MNTLPLKVFITYSHKNSTQNKELKTCLAVMDQERKIKIWDDNQILPGDEWEKNISDNLAESHILLYLVSAASLASENCNKELAKAFSAEIRVIPIILESCDWDNHQLSNFQALPDRGKPINKWKPESDGWQNVVAGIRQTIKEMQAQADSEKESHAEMAFQQGNFFMMVKQLDMAIERYSHAIELAPNFAAHLHRGGAYLCKGEYDKAIRDLTTAIELDPNDAAHFHRGVASLNKGEFDKAILDLTTAIELNPNFANVSFFRGIAWLYLKEWEKARSDLTDAKNKGMDIINVFYYDYPSIENFEKTTGIQLPPDIVAMLTPPQDGDGTEVGESEGAE